MGDILTELSASPILAFTVLLLVTLTIPPIFERLRLPGLVGLLVAGVFLGNDGLQVLSADDEAMKLLTDIGKIYLMFVAGLEIDLEQFRQTRNRSLTFGFATFLIPLIVGTLIGQIFGFGLNTSVLLGSLLASHTLLGYPIVQRLGVVKNEAVTVTIGATIFTDIAALLVLAICISIHAGEFSAASLIIQLSVLAIYAVLVLFGFDWAGKEYFRRTGDEEGNQFLFVLLAVFLASVGAEAINVDKIVGAFLAGLAINDVVGRGPVEEKIEFVGSTLFIPFFFVGMGLLLDVPAFIENLTTNLGLTLAVVGGLIVAKLLAAIATKGIFRYSWNETMTMWALSMPQVAATLAAALAALQVGLINDALFNTIIVLMLVTSLLGPLVTERFAPKLKQSHGALDSSSQQKWLTVDGEFDVDEKESDSTSMAQSVATLTRLKPFTIVVPVYNPLTERYLIEMAALMASYTSGMAVPLAIVKAHVHMDEPQLVDALKQGHRLLERAIATGEEFGVTMSPAIRIDDDIAEGISRTAREKSADLIVMGWSETLG
ncbi:MAG: cation:proton antiporter, partial [Elainellaceae cyanobacterium]